MNFYLFIKDRLRWIRFFKVKIKNCRTNFFSLFIEIVDVIVIFIVVVDLVLQMTLNHQMQIRLNPLKKKH